MYVDTQTQFCSCVHQTGWTFAHTRSIANIAPLHSAGSSFTIRLQNATKWVKRVILSI